MHIDTYITISNDLSVDNLLKLIKAYNVSCDNMANNNTIVTSTTDLYIIRASIVKLLDEIDNKISQHPDAKAQEAFDKYVTTGKYKQLLDK